MTSKTFTSRIQGFNDDDKVFSCRLVYGNVNALEFNKTAGIENPEHFIPMWEIRIARNNKSRIKEVLLFINAVSGELLKKGN